MGAWSSPSGALTLSAGCRYRETRPGSTTVSGSWTIAAHPQGTKTVGKLVLRCDHCSEETADIYTAVLEEPSLMLTDLCGSETVAAGSAWKSGTKVYTDDSGSPSASVRRVWHELVLSSETQAKDIHHSLIVNAGIEAGRSESGTWAPSEDGFTFHGDRRQRSYSLFEACVFPDDGRYTRSE